MDVTYQNTLTGKNGKLAAPYFIDATEAGDLLPLANIDKDDLVGTSTILMSDLFTASWMSLATPQAMFGAAAGAAMIFAAIRLRRWKDEG